MQNFVSIGRLSALSMLGAVLISLMGCSDDSSPADSWVSADLTAADTAPESGTFDALSSDLAPSDTRFVDLSNPDILLVPDMMADAELPGSAYYFQEMGLVDNGPPLFLIVPKNAFDAGACTPATVSVVPLSVLPGGFSLDTADPSNVSYRYSGATANGTAALVGKGFVANASLDKSC